MTKLLVAAAASAALLSSSALAQSQPPEGALPLSQILQSLEEGGDVAYFDEIEWDSDGYWEVEYYRPDGAKVEIDIDPLSGEAR